jgi:glycosyltransferase involved in cell wall biosynthesis
MATVADHQGSVRRAATAALSIVIPTRDRVDTLQRTLDALEGQRDLDGDLQIVVVDDGSRDGTAEILRSRPYGRHALQVIRQEPAGPAAARNRGIRQCTSDRVLLLGDDTIPQPQCVAAHLEAAAGRDVAVQGMIDWDPEVGITPLMEFMAPEGPQFYFKGLDEGDPVDWTRMAGSNLSAPRAWFETEPFDEGFRTACFEDTEMAYRWSRHSWNGVFSRRACCLHRHRYDEPDRLMARQRWAGVQARAVVQRHPRLIWRLSVGVAIGGFLVALRAAPRWTTGRATPEDRWDAGWRLEYLLGLCSTFVNRRSDS